MQTYKFTTKETGCGEGILTLEGRLRWLVNMFTVHTAGYGATDYQPATMLCFHVKTKNQRFEGDVGSFFMNNLLPLYNGKTSILILQHIFRL